MDHRIKSGTHNIRVMPETDVCLAERLMKEAGVDGYGIGIMAPKAVSLLIKIKGLSNISANILKQELLSLGADAAISRGSLTGKVKKTDCLVMGNLAQYQRLRGKLERQPFGLGLLAEEVNRAIINFQKEDFILSAGSFRIKLGRKTGIAAIINITPDSFSNDGIYRGSIADVKARALTLAERAIQDGADIIDIGGESSRPGAAKITIREELKRVIPVIRFLAKKINKPVSIDTYKPEVADAAVDCGASIINDITALSNIKMRRIAARAKAAVVLMHMKGTPRTMQKNPAYSSIIDEILDFLKAAAAKAEEAGVKRESIVVDPGIGFGKTARHNLEIIRHLKEFRGLGLPIMAGISRKSFIGHVLGLPVNERSLGTASAAAACILNGASIIRVHDAGQARQVRDMVDAVRGA
ncbi:MAG: dihydropteroate synthase [Candidatus Omnitrophica bacterium]|nr:dihydropteroate synthase [Candidatus Omnitrophota bacterium]